MKLKSTSNFRDELQFFLANRKKKEEEEEMIKNDGWA